MGCPRLSFHPGAGEVLLFSSSPGGRQSHFVFHPWTCQFSSPVTDAHELCEGWAEPEVLGETRRGRLDQLILASGAGTVPAQSRRSLVKE